MTRLITALTEVAPQYRAVFCDLWGCLHDGRRAYPEAVAALQAFRAQGGVVLLLTNSPRPRPSVIAQIDALGVPRDAWDEVASSGDAAQHALLTGAVGRRVYHIGPEKDLPVFTEVAGDLREALASEEPIVRVPLDDAEGIVVTGPFDDTKDVPDDYCATFLLAKTRGLPLLCANPDIVVDYGDKRVFCAGALAELYDQMGGTSLYFGKPHPPIYDLARRRLAALGDPIADDEILCIGDGIATDIQGGVSEGLDTLFVTAGIAATDFGPNLGQPDPALLTAWLSARQIAPTCAIGHLR